VPGDFTTGIMEFIDVNKEYNEIFVTVEKLTFR
jgi:hypothetical protein